MMDGQVGAIRELLDKSGFEHTAIIAYAEKYATGRTCSGPVCVVPQ